MSFNGNDSAALAAQREAISPIMPALMLTSSYLWGKMEAMDGVTPVGTRPTRIPTLPQIGANPSVPNFDGGPLGRGQAPQEVTAYVSCASYLLSIEWTLLSDWATDSDAKAIKSFSALTHEMAPKAFGSFMDVMAQNPGNNVIDTVVSVNSGALGVGNANNFQSGQYIDIFTAANGAFVTTLQVADEDPNGGDLIHTTTAIPGTVLAGMAIAVHGSTATSNSGMFGLQYYNVLSATGNYLGIQRPSYPSRYVANGVALNNQGLTQSVFRAMQVAGARAIGGAYEKSEKVIHCGPDGVSAWESNYTGVITATRESAGARSLDMLPKDPPQYMGGLPILGPDQWGNPRAAVGRIDALDLSVCKRLETKMLGEIEWGGQSDWPVVASDGGYASSTISYMGVVSQIVILDVRKQGVITGFSKPAYWGT